MSTLFTILIKVKVYTVILRNSVIRVYTICNSEHFDQGLHYLPFSVFWSKSTIFAILSGMIRVYTYSQSHQPISIYTTCNSQQSSSILSFSGTIWSGSTLFAILSSLIRVYIVCHPQQSDQGLHSLPSDQHLHCLPLSAVLSDQHLHCLPFSTNWSTSTLFTILSSLIRVYTVCHSRQSDQSLHYLPILPVWSGSTLFTILSK